MGGQQPHSALGMAAGAAIVEKLSNDLSDMGVGEPIRHPTALSPAIASVGEQSLNPGRVFHFSGVSLHLV